MRKIKGRLKVKYNDIDYTFTNLDIYGLRGEGFLEIVDNPEFGLCQQFFAIRKLRNVNYANVGNDIIINGCSISALIQKAEEKEFKKELECALSTE